MLEQGRAPNRLLDLDELRQPGFCEHLDRMDTLRRQDPVSYIHPSKRWEYPWALSRTRVGPGARVLDAGCGASIFPIYLREQGFRVAALDLSPPAGLGVWHDRVPDYVAGNIGRLPFGPGCFDAIFCISVIEHMGFDGMVQAMAEFHRVLKPRGQLLLTTDYFENADADLVYEGEGGPFPVDWSFFDEPTLQQRILRAPGWRLDGTVDLKADWETIKPVMRRFHGYPYTSVGVALIRAG